MFSVYLTAVRFIPLTILYAFLLSGCDWKALFANPAPASLLDAPIVKQLEAINGPLGPELGGLVLVLDDNQIITSLGGTNVAPGCEIEGDLGDQSADKFLSCLLETHGALLSGGKLKLQRENVIPTQVSSFGEAGGVIKFRQALGGVPIGDSSFSVLFREGRAIFMGGRLLPAGELLKHASPKPDEDRKAVLQKVQQLTKKKLAEHRRYYSMNDKAVVSEFLVVPARKVVIRYNETTGTVLDSYLAAARQAFVQREVPHLPGAHTLPGLNAPARPYLNLRQALEGNNSLSIYTDLINFEVLGPCEDNAIPAVINNDTYAQMGGALIEGSVNVSCTPGGEGIRNLSALGGLEFAMANTGFWFEDLARFANDAEVGYNGAIPWISPRILTVMPQTPFIPFDPEEVFMPRDAALAFPFGLRFADGRFWQSTDIFFPPWVDTYVGGATNLAGLAHEYGHHIAYSYGYMSITGAGRGITEGWANHNELRYALWRIRNEGDTPPTDVVNVGDTRRYDIFPGIPRYGMRIDGSSTGIRPWHDQDWFGGQLLPRVRPNGRAAEVLFNELDCDEGPYNCSAPLPQIYWELVWNRNRTEYLGMAQGEQIFQSTCGNSDVNGVPDIYQTINQAYTWALIVQPDTIGLEAEMDHVGIFMNAVYAFLITAIGDPPCAITPADLNRIEQVMAHHCVGPSDFWCDESLYLSAPGSPLPLSQTQHGTFAVGPGVHLHTADNMMPSGGAQYSDWSPRAECGQVVQLVPGVGDAQFIVIVPQEGVYQVEFAAASVPGSVARAEVADQDFQFGFPSPDSSTVVWSPPREIEVDAGLGVPFTIEAESGLIRLAALRMRHICTRGFNCSGQCGIQTDDCGTEFNCGACGPIAISAGVGHSCAVLDDNSMSCWGDNQFGQLGAGTGGPFESEPVVVRRGGDVFKNAQSVSTGMRHTCIVTNDPSFFGCWGDNRFGALGMGLPESQRLSGPDVFRGTGGDEITRLVSSGFHSCLVTTEAELFCWGSNLSRQITGVAAFYINIVRVPLPWGVIDVAVGGDGSGNGYTCVINEDGEVFCWGSNSFGQVGRNAATNVNPAEVSMGPATDAVSITGGEQHVCATTDTTTVKCWGNNSVSQLGRTSSTGSMGPTEILAFSVEQADAGGRHTCVIFENDNLRCWGSGSQGQLGIAGPATAEPNLHSVANDVTDVSAGRNHSCAIIAGTIHCWGQNNQVQLGVGDTGPRAEPEAVVLP